MNQCKSWELLCRNRFGKVGRNAHLAATVDRLEEGSKDEGVDLIHNKKDLREAGEELDQKLEECKGTTKKEKISSLVGIYEEIKERGTGETNFFQSMDKVVKSKGHLESLRGGNGIDGFVREMVDEMSDKEGDIS